MLILVLLLAWNLMTIADANATIGNDNTVASMARVAKLLTPVLGLEDVDLNSHVHRRRSSPNRYMVDLYRSVADTRTGLTVTANPYDAKTVTSLPLVNFTTDSSKHRLLFDLSSLKLNGKIIEAELRIYKSRSRLYRKSRGSKFHLMEIHVYQVTRRDSYLEGGVDMCRGRLLDAKRVSSTSTGWEMFFIKPAIIDWLNNSRLNRGLCVTLRNMHGHEMDSKGILRMGGRHMHHFEPTLVLYNSDRDTKADKDEYGSMKRTRLKKYQEGQENRRRGTKRRKRNRRRSSGNISKRSLDNGRDQCRRHQLVVDFEKIGWADWIISPKAYNAYYCKGTCPFPLGQNLKPTNHATVQSIVQRLGLYKGVTAPCCVPNKLSSVSLLYYDDRGNVVLKQYDDMVAASCACH